MSRAPRPSRAPLAAVAAVLGAAALAGCGGGEANAPVLWLALDGRETEVTFIDHEPPPY